MIAIARALLRAPGLTANDPIVPDLAYGLPVRPVPPPNGPRLVIGISPMNYRHPDHWPQRDVAAYREHVTSLGGLAARLLARGCEVVIFTTDRDGRRRRTRWRQPGALRPEERSRLRIAETDTLPALFATLSGLDVVVAARLHGVLLAHLAHRPVLAIAHERKVRTLMRDSGQERYCVEIDAADPEILDRQLQTLIAERAALGEQIAAYVASCRSRVALQFDALFGPGPAGLGRRAAAPWSGHGRHGRLRRCGAVRTEGLLEKAEEQVRGADDDWPPYQQQGDEDRTVAQSQRLESVEPTGTAGWERVSGRGCRRSDLSTRAAGRKRPATRFPVRIERRRAAARPSPPRRSSPGAASERSRSASPRRVSGRSRGAWLPPR